MRIKERLIITTDLCDGFSIVPDKVLEEDYKKFYHWIKKDDQVMFPFIYVVVAKLEEWTQKCMCFIPRKKYIYIENKKKTF